MGTEHEPNNIDLEMWEIADAEKQLHKDALYNLLMAYGFLVTSFFSHADNVSVDIEVGFEGDMFTVDGEEMVKKLFPAIIGVEGNRLVAMGEKDYVSGMVEIFKEEWRTR